MSGVRLLLVALFALVAVLPAGQAVAAANASDGSGSVSASLPDAQPPSATPSESAPNQGPKIEPEQAGQRTKQKLAIGVIAIVLLAIVIWGRRTRTKRRKKISGGVTK